MVTATDRTASALVGIDVGGTHTDVVVIDDDAQLAWADKVPSDPTAPIRALRRALATIPEGARIGLCVNGTTIGINAVLQRRFPRVGLVATAGFGDLLLIRRETKANIYDLDWRKPPPLVPRELTYEVRERIDANGEVVEPLSGLAELGVWVNEHELDDIAICLLHSYRNPMHEQAVREAILAARPGARVTLSSEVWPEWREFERTYNTALNAALKPVVAEYITGLVDAVEEVAGHRDVLLMHADGGVLQPEEIAERPVLTLLSGTVAGALLGAHVAETVGATTAVSLDMGGTSTDIALSHAGRPRRSAELSIEWEGTLGFAGIDVVSIGAGGGSVAWADEAGGLHVGPVSAGADPGPACYGLGGTVPALTDANLLLGYLGPEPTMAGRRLDADLAREAFTALAARTGLADERLYAGVYSIATSNLTAGIRRATIERGIDPRACSLICFGGAGPLHAAMLVQSLGLASAVIPPRPGNGSAVGLLLAPLKHSVSQTFYSSLDELPSPSFERLTSRLRNRAIAALPEPRSSADVTWSLSMRYRGQTRDLTIDVTDGEVAAFTDDVRGRLTAAFHAAHEREFTFRAVTEPVQLVTVRCEASVPAHAASVSLNRPREQPAAAAAASSTVAFFLDADGAPEPLETTVLHRDSLVSGSSMDGPAVILDLGSTILLPPGATASIDATTNLILEWRDA